MLFHLALTLLLASRGLGQPVDQPEAAPAVVLESEIAESIPEGFEVVDILYIPKVVQDPEEIVDTEDSEADGAEGEDQDGDFDDWFGTDLVDQIEANEVQTESDTELVRTKRSPWQPHGGGCFGRKCGRGFRGGRRRRRFRNRRPKVVIDKVIVVQQKPIVHKPIPYKHW